MLLILIILLLTLLIREKLYLSLLVSTAADGMIFVLVENKRRNITRYLVVPSIRNAISELSLRVWARMYKLMYKDTYIPGIDIQIYQVLPGINNYVKQMPTNKELPRRSSTRYVIIMLFLHHYTS